MKNHTESEVDIELKNKLIRKGLLNSGITYYSKNSTSKKILVLC